MKRLFITLVILLLFYTNPLHAQIIQGSFEGTELACLSSTDSYDYYWSNAATTKGEKITYSIKDRSGNSISSTDVTSSTSNGVLTLVIDKNHFDIIITMTVKIGTATKKFTKRVQVGLGDRLTRDMITVSPTTVRCRDNTTQITIDVDKENVYGVDFLWTLPSGWVQTVGGNDNYIKVRPDGIHVGNITCQMKVYGDEFCGGNEVENYLGSIIPIVYDNLTSPNINRILPTGNSTSLTYNSTAPITFTVSSKSGATYTWSLPCGWKAPNGQTGTYVTPSSSVQLTPSGYSGPGEQVKVVANIDCAGTSKNSNYVTWSLEWGSGQEPYIIGSSTVCTSSSSFSLNSVPTAASVTWSKSSNLVYVSGQGTNAYKVKASSAKTSGRGYVQASIGQGGCMYPVPQKTVWVGKPSVNTNPSGVPAIEAGLGSWVVIRATSTPGALTSSLNWWTNNSSALNLNPGYGNCSVECQQLGYNFVYVTASNVCGVSPYRQIPINVTTGGGGQLSSLLKVRPNPADNEITVNLTGIFVKRESGNAEVYLYNKSNKVVFHTLTKEQSLVIPTRNLVDGLYFLNATYLDKTFQRHILIKH